MGARWLLTLGISLAWAVTAAAASDDDPIVSRIPREPVTSSALAAVGYSKRLHALEIEFRNGAVYRYLDVPIDVYRGLLGASSKARYYDEHVRGRYRSLHVKRREQ